jgi:hypothetical protein
VRTSFAASLALGDFLSPRRRGAARGRPRFLLSATPRWPSTTFGEIERSRGGGVMLVSDEASNQPTDTHNTHTRL